MSTILIVDDSVSLLALLEKTVRDAGFEVRTATSGRRALRILHTEHVDLVVTDIYMSDTDGLELLIAIKRMNPQPPVIAMSSDPGRMRTLESARLLGAKHTLPKPFAPNELLRSARAVLAAQAAVTAAHLQSTTS